VKDFLAVRRNGLGEETAFRGLGGESEMGDLPRLAVTSLGGTSEKEEVAIMKKGEVTWACHSRYDCLQGLTDQQLV